MSAEDDGIGSGMRGIPEAKDLDRAELLSFGEILEGKPASLGGVSTAVFLIEHLLKVRTKSGRVEKLTANPAQKLFEQQRGERNIVLKARQMGLTTWVAARFFLKTITQPGTLTLQVAQTQEAAEEIFRIVRRFWDNLPANLREGPLRTSRASSRQMVFPEMDSQYRVESAGDKNAGRGLTVQNLHVSELARWPGDPAEILAGLRAAMAPVSELVIESTPNGVGGCFYEEWHGAAERGVAQHFFPWWLEPGYVGPRIGLAEQTAEERDLAALHGLSDAQIGFRRQARSNLRGLARQEFAEDAESCFLTSGETIFEMGPVEERLRTVPEPIERRRNGQLEIWLPPLPGKAYVVAVDPAGGGSGGDYSAIEVLEIESGLQCAEFAGHVGGLELARLCVELATEYNRAWLVVERNNHGGQILAYAGPEVLGYGRVYHQTGRVGGNGAGYGSGHGSGVGMAQAGWLTTSTSRPEALGRLAAALVERPECFQSRRLLAECRTFVRLSNGGTGARSGAHDDRVMAMAIALGARAELLMRGRRL